MCKKVSAKEEIEKSFSSVKNLKEWSLHLKEYFAWKQSIIKNNWFIMTIFTLPNWNNESDFRQAVNEVFRIENTWQDSDWFKVNIIKKFEERNKKNNVFSGGPVGSVFSKSSQPTSSPATSSPVVSSVTQITSKQSFSQEFKNVVNFFEWENVFEKYFHVNPSIVTDKIFIEDSFKLPFWVSLHEFSRAIEKFLKVNKSLENSDWFYEKVWEKYKPEPSKTMSSNNHQVKSTEKKEVNEPQKAVNNLTISPIGNNSKITHINTVVNTSLNAPVNNAVKTNANQLFYKEISECKTCGKNVFWVETKLGKLIPLDTKLIYKQPSNYELMVFTIDKEIGKIKDLNSGYTIHLSTCKYANLSDIKEFEDTFFEEQPEFYVSKTKHKNKNNSKVFHIREFIPVLPEDKIPV